MIERFEIGKHYKGVQNGGKIYIRGVLSPSKFKTVETLVAETKDGRVFLMESPQDFLSHYVEITKETFEAGTLTEDVSDFFSQELLIRVRNRALERIPMLSEATLRQAFTNLAVAADYIDARIVRDKK